MPMKRRSPSETRIRQRIAILQAQRDADTASGITNPIVEQRLKQLAESLRQVQLPSSRIRDPRTTEGLIRVCALRAQDDTRSLMRRYTAWRDHGDADMRVMRVHATRLFSTDILRLFELGPPPEAHRRVADETFVWGVARVRDSEVYLHVWRMQGGPVLCGVTTASGTFRAGVPILGLSPFSAFNRLCAILAEMFNIVPMPTGWHDPLEGQPYDSSFDNR